VRDEIDFDVATFRYVNLGRSLHRGIEARAARAAGRFPLSLGYAWSRVTPDGPGASGGQLRNLPEHTAHASVSTALGSHATVRSGLRWIGPRGLDDAGTARLPGAVLWDLRAEWRVRRARLRLDVLNVTGREWAPAGFLLGGEPWVFPAPGRQARLSVGF
jgi:outer membrane receptor protein involved in Fe transport